MAWMAWGARCGHPPGDARLQSRMAMVTKTALTNEELEKLPAPEQGGGYELDEGEPVYVSPNSLEQARVIYRIYARLNEWAESTKLGLVAPDTWFELSPGVVRAPDVAFVPAERLTDIDPKHVLKVAPALVVEVLSLRNTAREISRKIQQYRDAGVSSIWVVDSDKKEVDVHSSLPLRTLREADILADQQVLPGFSMPVSQIFASIF